MAFAETADHADFSAHSFKLDPDRSAVDMDTDHGTFVPIVLHPALVTSPRMSKADKKALAIKQAALRVAAGMEMRSLREIADEIGCCHQAIANALARICTRLGIKLATVSEDTRKRQSEARKRSIAQAKGQRELEARAPII